MKEYEIIIETIINFYETNFMLKTKLSKQSRKSPEAYVKEHGIFR